MTLISSRSRRRTGRTVERRRAIEARPLNKGFGNVAQALALRIIPRTLLEFATRCARGPSRSGKERNSAGWSVPRTRANRCSDKGASGFPEQTPRGIAPSSPTGQDKPMDAIPLVHHSKHERPAGLPIVANGLERSLSIPCLVQAVNQLAPPSPSVTEFRMTIFRPKRH
jgi:hypothetical protein